MTERIPNAEQQAVIDELDQNIILFASAGTGKTFTVAKRVCNIIDRERAKPEEILCLTFTIKAANEMKEDILHHVGADGLKVITRTIHSFAYQVLKEESARNPAAYSLPNVMDDTDEEDALKTILLSIGLDERALIFTGKSFLTGFVGELKRHREAIERYTDDEKADFQAVYCDIQQNHPSLFQKMMTFYSYSERTECKDQKFLQLMEKSAGEFVSSYNSLLRQSNLLDFDDLICQTHRLFKSEAARQFWRARYKYIFIDEMQDTNELEYDTLRNLFPGNHIMMCGDYFQTIYEWRGSNPEHILGSYVREFHAQPHMFSENYRATRLLTNATFGYLKNTYPDLMGKYCPAEVITRSAVRGDRIMNIRTNMSEDVADWIYHYLEEHTPEDPTKICIMSRTHRNIAAIYNGLREISLSHQDGHELHFFTVDNDAKFFRRRVIKDILAFLRVLLNRTDAVSLSRIILNNFKGVGPKTIERINQLSEIGISITSMIDPGSYDDGDPFAKLIAASGSSNIVVYDTETTGLDLTKDQIIQISAIRLNQDGEIIDTLDQLVIPTIEISEGAAATHHRTIQDIIENGGIGIHEALQKFSAFVDGAVLVGHNSLRFDAPLVRRQLRECGLPPLRIIAEYDTMVIAKQFHPVLVNYKLETLCSKYGIVNREAHNALGDITATGELLYALLKESICPTQERRKAVLAEHLPRFQTLYTFLSQLSCDYLEPGNVYGLVENIIDRCRLKKRFPEDGNLMAMSDLLYVMQRSDFTDARAFLREFLDDAALSGSQMDLLIRKLRKIPIITVHQSKGCEFDTVIIAGAEDTVFPTFNAIKHGDIEEEKRVFYVAISRAKKQLILVSRSYRVGYNGTRYDVQQSPFIDMIPREYVDTIRVP